MTNFTAVITGANKGIGLAIATEFASRGFNIFLGGRDQESLKRVSENLKTTYQVNCAFYAADLSIANECQKFVNSALSFNPIINVLVNNAGVFLPGELMTSDQDILEDLMSVNVYSAFRITKQLWNSLKLSDRAHVFNMCSVASIKSYSSGGAYAITKHALLGFSRSLREEGKDNRIAVTSILPGATYTNSWSDSGISIDRFMKPEDIAKMMVTSWEINQSSVVEELLIRPFLGDI